MLIRYLEYCIVCYPLGDCRDSFHIRYIHIRYSDARGFAIEGFCLHGYGILFNSFHYYSCGV